MGDTFWMEDDVRVEWEEAAQDCGRIFQKPNKPVLRNILSFMDSQIKDFIFQKAQYPITDTGSQYLDPLWRQNIIKVNSDLTKIQAFISLN